MGLPPLFIGALRKLYANNLQLIMFANQVFLGPLILTGIKQGCPLSMVIFTLCLEPFLRRLSNIMGREDQLGAFADDIAAVFKNLWKVLPEVAALFDEFALVSNISLNIAKCVAMPLDPFFDLQCFKDWFFDLAPQWKDFAVKLHAEYLGFQLGPEGTEKMWENCCRKAIDTTNRWRNVKAGFFFNVIASNIYILPLFSYIGQLACTDDHVDKALLHLKSTLFAGPGSWLPDLFLTHLRVFGLHAELRDIKTTIRASKVRLALTSELAGDALETLAADSWLEANKFKIHHGEDHPYAEWHGHIFAVNICRELLKFKREGGMLDPEFVKLQDDILGKKKRIQKVVTKYLAPQGGQLMQSLAHLLRTRMARWNMDILEGYREPRLRKRLLALQGKVKPSVWVQYYKTCLNGWVTRRRMESLVGAITLIHCPLCGHGDDSIEHYCRCRVVRALFRRHGLPFGGMANFLGLYQDALPFKIVDVAKCLATLFVVHSTCLHSLADNTPLNTVTLITSAERSIF